MHSFREISTDIIKKVSAYEYPAPGEFTLSAEFLFCLTCVNLVKRVY